MSEQENIQDVVAEEAVEVSGPPVGELLRLAREERGLEVADIAQTLKLGQRQVEALEIGDWKSLPGNTFIRGFVRNYARLVQIDATPLMAQLDRILEKPVSSLGVSDVVPSALPHIGSAGSRRSKTVVLSGAVLVLLAVLTSFLLPADLSSLRESAQSLLDSLARKDKEAAVAAPAAEPVFPPGSTPQQVMNPQALAPAEVQPAPAPGKAPAAEDANVGQSGTVPQLRFVADKESWLEVRDRDNKVIFSQRMTAGSEKAMDGHGPLSLSVGYAPGVRVFWHGEAVDLAPHTRGDVARLVLE